MALAAALLLLLPASALAGAGLKPSEAPLVTVGQHYFGNTKHTANVGGPGEEEGVDLWRLPPLLTGDAITIAWHSEGPRFCLASNVDDYNWAEGYRPDFWEPGVAGVNVCNASAEYGVASNSAARSVVGVRSATSDAFLEFFRWEGAYDFTIESIQHAIGVGLTAVTSITPTSTLTGSANLSNGSPVPDGLAFTLSASWVTPVNKASHSRSYTVTSGGGALAFPLNLPTSAQGKHVSLTVTRPADPQYLAASSPAIEATVAKLTPPPRKHHRHRHCPRGFKKHRVRGKVRCVRVRHHPRHRRRYASASASSHPRYSPLVQESLRAGAPHVKQAELLRTGRTGQILGVEIHFDAAPAGAVGKYKRIEQYQLAIKGKDGKLRPFSPPFFWGRQGAFTSDRAGEIGGSFKRPPNTPSSQIKRGEKAILLMRERIKRLSDNKIVAEVIRRHGFKVVWH